MNINHVNQVFREYFGSDEKPSPPTKNTASVATEIIADQERLDEERAGRRRADNGNERDWSGLTNRGKVRNEHER